MFKRLVDIDVRWVALSLSTIAFIAMAISKGDLPLTNAVPSALIPGIVAWSGIIAFVCNAIMMAHNGAALLSPRAAAAVTKVLLILAAAALWCILTVPANAQTVRRAAPEPNVAEAAAPVPLLLPCLQPLDARPSCHNGIFAPSGVLAKADGSPGETQTNPTCDFGTFQVITPQNITGILQACGIKLLNDSQAALDSAKAANDNVAQACLTPGTALIKAGVGTPATPGDPTATPPVAPTAAQLGGPLLLFQKYREFVNAGGISSCASWVNTVIAAQVGSAAGVAGAAAGVVALSPIK